MLLDDGLLFREPDSPAVLSTGGGRHWPEGRGVLLLQGSEGGNVWAWVNEEEHFKLHIVPCYQVVRRERFGARGTHFP